MKYEERESAQRPLIQLENLVKVYDTGALKVLGLKKINLTIHRENLWLSWDIPVQESPR